MCRERAWMLSSPTRHSHSPDDIEGFPAPGASTWRLNRENPAGIVQSNMPVCLECFPSRGRPSAGRRVLRPARLAAGSPCICGHGSATPACCKLLSEELSVEWICSGSTCHERPAKWLFAKASSRMTVVRSMSATTSHSFFNPRDASPTAMREFHWHRPSCGCLAALFDRATQTGRRQGELLFRTAWPPGLRGRGHSNLTVQIAAIRKVLEEVGGAPGGSILCRDEVTGTSARWS